MGVINALDETEKQIRDEAQITEKLMESKRSRLTEKARTLQVMVDTYRVELEAIRTRDRAR